MRRYEFFHLLFSLGAMIASLSYGFMLSAVDYHYLTNLTAHQVDITNIQVEYEGFVENTLCVCTPKGIFNKKRPCDVHVFSGETCSTEECGSIIVGNKYSLLTSEDGDCYDKPFVNQKIADSRFGVLIFGLMDAPIMVLFVLVYMNPPNYFL